MYLNFLRFLDVEFRRVGLAGHPPESPNLNAVRRIALRS